MASEIIFGQLRLTIATLTIEQINQDREVFLKQVSSNVDSELHKIGLYLINVNITDITDEAEYIVSIGAKAAAEAIAGATGDRAKALQMGQIQVATADSNREIEVQKKESAAIAGKAEAKKLERIAVQEAESESKMGIAAAVSREEISVQDQQKNLQLKA